VFEGVEKVRGGLVSQQPEFRLTENLSHDERDDWMNWVLTGFGKWSSGVDLPVSVLDGDEKRGKVIGLMLSGDDVGWVNLVAELDGGQRDFGHLISSKSVAVAVIFVTKTGGHGPTLSHVGSVAGNTPTAGGVNHNHMQGE